jgi:hypothetical protein
MLHMARVRPLPRDKIRFRYRSQFGLVIVCPDEKAQRRGYGRLRRLGYKVRVVTV